MSESAEFWQDMKPILKEKSRQKKQSNYDQSKQQLVAKGVLFIEKPNGHFIILNAENKPTHDFWATTGKIIERKTKRQSRGIRNLLRFAQNSSN